MSQTHTLAPEGHFLFLHLFLLQNKALANLCFHPSRFLPSFQDPGLQVIYRLSQLLVAKSTTAGVWWLPFTSQHSSPEESLTECEQVNTPRKLAAMGLEEKGWKAGLGLGDQQCLPQESSNAKNNRGFTSISLSHKRKCTLYTNFVTLSLVSTQISQQKN